ncbi:hypothetical protein IMG5_109710 [Ichthyophthirius multifiliis]|uniref:WD40-repeat-containing domain n=1 Tax=Ichthyophthirius multifiliis TaxID=5932 RepID=G0QTL8_ICHMU|nr:hypothetical protein IMG5_109710 [Ichthyophthirius multifiliis]EGR31432.1 hypothetical protein IMG5_109710 [Ichthyophthirius multifiliis]|eukprot:XP_004034918.1 hypothetical protein IMG5_109710 [Ichthyophthirius multifiliis]
MSFTPRNRNLTNQNKPNELDSLIQKLISYQNSQKQILYNTINQKYLIQQLDKDKIQQLELLFEKRKIDIIDFVHYFIKQISHNEEERIYVIMATIDLYRSILQKYGEKTKINTSNLLSYICEVQYQIIFLYFLFIKIQQDKNYDQYKIQSLQVPETNKYNINTQKIRQVDQNMPPLYGKTEENLNTLSKEKFYSDQQHHLNQNVKQGFYAKEMNCILSLDNLSNKIDIFTLDCKLKQKIKPNSQKNNENHTKINNDVIIFNFTWSERQQRIGATLKDLKLSFWDLQDNFQYEKQINIQNQLSEYQLNIWFLDLFNTWVTTDSKNKLYFWDIEKEIITLTISNPKIKHTIFQILEITQLRLLAVASLDRIITIWDINKCQIVQEIELSKSGIHFITYFSTYQSLICSGFENNIQIFQIKTDFLDITHKGVLIGHFSIITAIDCIEKTHLIISADDSGVLKLWDIRTLKCIQSINYGNKTKILKLINIYEKGKLCFLGTRVNILSFLEKNENQLQKKQTNFPIKCVLQDNNMLVFSEKDLKFIDIQTGQVKQAFVGIQGDLDGSISACEVFDQANSFIIGNSNGLINMHNMFNGDLLFQLDSHQNEVSGLKVDFINKMLISCGWDSIVKVQQILQNGKVELKRQIDNCYWGKQVNLIEFSIHHNIILIGSDQSEKIYVYDYEFFNILTQLELNNCLTKFNFIKMYIISLNQQRRFNYFRLKKYSLEFSIYIIYYIKVKLQSLQSFQIKFFKSKILLLLFFFKQKIQQKQNIQGIKNPLIKLQILKSQMEQCLINNQEKLQLKIEKAHKDQITTLDLIKLEKPSILTSSIDSYIRIWEKQTGKMLASLNINHPLPILWNINLDIFGECKKKLTYTLKILDIIYQKYQNEMNRNDISFINVQNFLKKLIQEKEDENVLQQKQMIKQQKIIMKDEFQPRDLQFEQTKQFFANELLGNSLKRMEANKRVAIATSQWNKEQQYLQNMESFLNQNNKFNKNNEDQEQINNFLNINYRQNLLKKRENNSLITQQYSENTQNLEQKLNTQYIQQWKYNLYIIYIYIYVQIYIYIYIYIINNRNTNQQLSIKIKKLKFLNKKNIFNKIHSNQMISQQKFKLIIQICLKLEIVCILQTQKIMNIQKMIIFMIMPNKKTTLIVLLIIFIKVHLLKINYLQLFPI